MQKFVIDGGVPLSGTLTPAGNKNGALPILAASVLTDEEVVIRNVPRIRDVETMLQILERLGVTVEWRDEHEVALCAADVDESGEIDPDLAER
ncbi:MAG: UDP-N-acetylglucosamine 1-carboxyvinyltransferase, partial [Actinomycetota bacterium]|nr:UDP-N-acetylglucosamine 1-carboxyvinyltransferase [Actinomycetota bacterium]